jgi:predicted HAD superfamily Cof-like phosphohydrolase
LGLGADADDGGEGCAVSENWIDDVAEFHRANGAPIAERCGWPKVARVVLRDDLIREEVTELATANQSGDMVGVADGIADLIYVLIGTAVEYGIPLQPIWDEVHRANMSKLGENGKPVLRADGKVMKGPNYSPPDVERVLRETGGWKP